MSCHIVSLDERRRLLQCKDVYQGETAKAGYTLTHAFTLYYGRIKPTTPQKNLLLRYMEAQPPPAMNVRITVALARDVPMSKFVEFCGWVVGHDDRPQPLADDDFRLLNIIYSPVLGETITVDPFSPNLD